MCTDILHLLKSNTERLVTDLQKQSQTAEMCVCVTHTHTHTSTHAHTHTNKEKTASSQLKSDVPVAHLSYMCCFPMAS